MHEIFEQCKEKIEDTQVPLDEFCTLLAEDEFFNDLMEQPVRKPYEGDLETLENLMNRMLTDHRGAAISWFQLLSFFSRRGKPSAEMHALHSCTTSFKDTVNIIKKGELSEAQKFQMKKENLSRKLNQTLGYK